MNPVRAAAIRDAIKIAEQRHAPRSHLYRELQMMVVEDLQAEIKAGFWPLPIISVCAALAAGSIAILFVAGVI